MTNEELAKAVEIELEVGRMGFNGLYSTNQQNWREAWSDVMDDLNQKCNDDFERWQPLRLMMLAALERHAGDNVQMRRQVYAINTTTYGREP